MTTLGVLSAADVEDVLTNGVVGRIGCIDDGRPYVVPVCYAYDAEFVYGHSMPGAKLRALQSNSQVCFEVEDVVDLSHWRSVISWGAVEILSGTAADAGLRLLVERVMPLLQPGSASARPHHSGTGAGAPAVYRIALGEKTGRFEG